MSTPSQTDVIARVIRTDVELPDTVTEEELRQHAAEVELRQMRDRIRHLEQALRTAGSPTWRATAGSQSATRSYSCRTPSSRPSFSRSTNWQVMELLYSSTMKYRPSSLWVLPGARLVFSVSWPGSLRLMRWISARRDTGPRLSVACSAMSGVTRDRNHRRQDRGALTRVRPSPRGWG
jgi:hypothetical protein